MKTFFSLPMLVIVLISLCGVYSCKQKNESIPNQANDKKTVTKTVDEFNEQSNKSKEPEFPGGFAALSSFINGNIKYPESAVAKGIEGKVLVSFTVDNDGFVKDAHIEKGIDTELDNEALRVVKIMPRWKPGSAGNVSMIIPVQFKLSSVKTEATSRCRSLI